MSMDYETNSSHYASSRTALWCPICGAKEGQGCTAIKGDRFSAHNNAATGNVTRTTTFTRPWETQDFTGRTLDRKDVPNRPKRRPEAWIN